MKRIAASILAFGLCLAPVVIAQETKHGETRDQGTEEKKGGMPEPSMFWQVANFIILVGVVVYFSRKVGAPFFNARAAEIRKGIDDAERIKADSSNKIAAINSKLGRLDSEIASLRESAAAERRAAQQRLKDETQRAIERIRLHAQAEIESAGKSERIALQRFAAQLALELAETKVRAHMNPNTEEALVQAFVQGLGVVSSRPQTHN